jgi:flavin-dependent dehydrogenase
MEQAEERWDAIVIGGALSGASTAFLLHRRNPRLRVLILEKDTLFRRRVGEATVEISGYFLGRVLGLTEHLNQQHLVKQGLRYWFANEKTQTLADCSETGPGYNVRFPGYQVDRSVLDEHLLQETAKGGVTVRRGVKVRDIELVDGGTQTVHWHDEDGKRGVERARWVVDASGVGSLLARKNGWFQPNRDHPIAAVWSRWSGVKNWDSLELAAKFPEYATRAKAIRFTATNQLMGWGWWAWFIPLKGGDVSVGFVYDQRFTDLPEGGSLGDRLRQLIEQHPAGKEMLSEAHFHEGDVHFRRNLAYCSSTFAGNGFVIVGDAAAFMDPFYSPGMDWISYSSSAAAALIDSCLRGKPAKERVERHNQRFHLSYTRWFESIYRDKYFYMGDQELMTLAFRLDLGGYYFGVVSQPFKYGSRILEIPSFASKYSGPPAKFISFYNRRLVKIAQSRRARGTWGRCNNGVYYGFTSYELNKILPLRMLKAIAAWGWLELREGWRTWFVTPRLPEQRPVHPTRVDTVRENPSVAAV